MLKELYRGQTLYRIRINELLSRYCLEGRTVDVGGGHAPDYFEYFKQAPDFKLEVVDGSMQTIDFEKDRLPYEDKGIDTVILCNVLEHIFNYQHLLNEVERVCRGQIIGCVPFQFQYHPDPHDYFRFTKEALRKLLGDEAEIVAIEGSPVMANFNNITLSLPSLVRPVAYLWYRMMDWIFVGLRPKSVERCPLGFVFRKIAEKEEK